MSMPAISVKSSSSSSASMSSSIVDLNGRRLGLTIDGSIIKHQRANHHSHHVSHRRSRSVERYHHAGTCASKELNAINSNENVGQEHLGHVCGRGLPTDDMSNYYGCHCTLCFCDPIRRFIHGAGCDGRLSFLRRIKLPKWCNSIAFWTLLLISIILSLMLLSGVFFCRFVCATNDKHSGNGHPNTMQVIDASFSELFGAIQYKIRKSLCQMRR